MKNYSKAFTKIFLSVISVIIVCMTIMGVSIYVYSSTVIKKELAQSNVAILSQLKNTTDTYILRMAENFISEKFLDVNSSSERLKIFGEDELGNRFLYDYYQELNQMVQSTDFISNIHIYIPHRKMMISSNGVKMLSEDFKVSEHDLNKVSIIEQGFKGVKWVNTYLDYGSQNTLTLLRKYPTGYRSPAVAVIAVDIDEDKVYSAINKITNYQFKNVFIADEKGNIISDADKNMLYQDISNTDYMQTILNSSDTSGYFITDVSGIKSLVTFSKSEYNNWNYVTINNANAVFSVSNFIFLFIIMMYIFILIMSVFGVYALSKNLYRPIGRILEVIHLLTGENKKGDEYTNITEVIHSLSTQMNDYKNKVMDIAPVAKNNLIMELLTDVKLSEEDIKNYFEILDIDPEIAQNFVILGFSFHYFGLNKEEERYLEYGFLEYIDTFANTKRFILSSLRAKNEVFVLIGSNSAENIGLAKILNNCVIGLRELEGIDFQIYVSDVVQSIDCIYSEYEKLEQMKNYGFIIGFNQILYYDAIKERDTSAFILDEKRLYEALEESIKEKDITEITKVINFMMHSLQNECVSYAYVQDFLMRFMAVISGLIKGSGWKTEEIIEDKNDIYTVYRQSNTMDEVFGFAQDICIQLVRKSNAEISEYSVANQVKEFVQNLEDAKIRDITLSYVADKLYLSQSYISRMFKKETGMNFVEYISEEKLLRSVRMLKEKNIKIKDISEEIGYGNANYFIRKFKERFGVTPRQYQRNLK